jgi:hypothetical protein
MSTPRRPQRLWVHGLALVGLGIVALIVNSIIYAPFNGSEERAEKSLLYVVAVAVTGVGLALALATAIVAWVADKKKTSAVGGASR